MKRYQIVVYCNKSQYRVKYQCQTLETAKVKYKQFLSEVKPPFVTEVKNRRKVEYFIGLVDNVNRRRLPAYTKDFMGRNVTMNMKDNQTLLEIKPYWLEEKIFDNHQRKHIWFDNLMEVLDKIMGIKMIYTINSHLFVEENQIIVGFYSLKNISDCDRLINAIINERLKEGKTDCLFSRDVDGAHKKYLYQHLNQFGYSLRGKLYRHYTR